MTAASIVLIVAEASNLSKGGGEEATPTRLPPDGCVLLVRPAELACASWTHTLRRNGQAATTVTLRSGQHISDDRLGAVLIRTESLAVPRFARSTSSDRNYAAAELRALFVSWVRSLATRAVNTPGGISLTGPSWTSRRWLSEAQRAGLRVAPSVLASSARLVPGWRGRPYDAVRPIDAAQASSEGLASVTVANGRVIDRSNAIADKRACMRLAANADCRVLDMQLRLGAEGATVVHAGPNPPLGDPYAADAAAVCAIADLLVHVAASPGR
jgi:hypothetical protein